MKHGILVLILTIRFVTLFSQNGDNYSNNNFSEGIIRSIEFHIGSSFGYKSSVSTGFIDNNRNSIKIITDGGYIMGGSMGYSADKFFDISIGFDYQSSSLSKRYSNGTGFFKRYVFYPYILMHPLHLYRYNLNVGFGTNCILFNNMDINFDIASKNSHVYYEFNKSFGLLFLADFQVFICKWISSSIGIKYNVNTLELSTFEIDNIQKDIKLAPKDIHSFDSNCLFYSLTIRLHHE